MHISASRYIFFFFQNCLAKVGHSNGEMSCCCILLNSVGAPLFPPPFRLILTLWENNRFLERVAWTMNSKLGGLWWPEMRCWYTNMTMVIINKIERKPIVICNIIKSTGWLTIHKTSIRVWSKTRVIITSWLVLIICNLNKNYYGGAWFHGFVWSRANCFLSVVP